MIASTTKREQPCTGNEEQQPQENSGKAEEQVKK
jgi:hypothetical protein